MDRIHIVGYTQCNRVDSYTSREQLLVVPWSSKNRETFSASDSALPPRMDSVWKHPLPSLQGTPRKNTMARRVGDVQFEGERTLDRNVASSRDTTESSVSKVLSCKQVACKKPLLVTERTESFHLALSTLSSSFLLLFVPPFLYFPFLLFFTVYTRTICSFIRFARYTVLVSSFSFFYHCWSKDNLSRRKREEFE